MGKLKDDVRRYIEAVATRVDSVGPPPAEVARLRRRARVLIVGGLLVAAAVAAAIVVWSDDGRQQVSLGPQAPAELPDGFTVVAGSQLVAPAIPAGVGVVESGSPVIDDGFVAVLEVMGNPVEVMGGYLDQAAALGMTLHQPAELPVTGGDEQPVGCQSQDGVFTCSAYARNADARHPRSVAMRFWRGQVNDARPISHLELRYSTISLIWEFGVVPSGGSSELAPPAVPDDITPGREDTSMFAHAEPISPVTVAEGSHLVADLALPLFSGPETLAMLQVPGEPHEVLERYTGGLADITGEDTITRGPLDVAGGQLVQVWASEAGGVSYELAFYESGREGTWILIRGAYD
jgi:hypothetical protein